MNGSPRLSLTWLRNIRIASVVLMPKVPKTSSASDFSLESTLARTIASFIVPL